METLRKLFLITIVLTAVPALARYPETQPPDEKSGKGAIASTYHDDAQSIVSATLAGNDAYRKMEELCDDIGHRLSGSKRLERAVQWAADRMRSDGQENVRLEPVEVPHWVRGKESLTMTSPQQYPMSMLGLGMSVGTPPEGITAPVVCVVHKDELDRVGFKAKGKIVLFNYPMPPYTKEHGTHYGDTVQYRSNGARWASKKGAIACLVRSVTATSLRTPHTGAMRYGDAKVRIPAAAITIEDAEMICRLHARGVEPVVTLKMEAKNLGTVTSHNVIGELVGREKPEEVVVIGGHIDSWDVGHGAHDDGAGCVMAMEAINVLRKLNMVPRRTIRVVLWTNEENGLAGGKEYARRYADDMKNHIVAIESDAGAFKPTGYGASCDDKRRENGVIAHMQEILSLLSHIGPMEIERGGGGADISPMKEYGVPMMGHSVDMSTYFNYHHTPADTLDKVDPTLLSENVAVMATVAYIIADMPQRFGDTAGAMETPASSR